MLPFNWIFYRRYEEDLCNRCKIKKYGELFETLNKYHTNIKLTSGNSRSKFLDTKLIIYNGTFETKVHERDKDNNTLESQHP